MLSRSFSDCQSLILNVIKFKFLKFSGTVNCVTKSLNHQISVSVSVPRRLILLITCQKGHICLRQRSAVCSLRLQCSEDSEIKSWLTYSFSQSVTTSPLELSWTAKIVLQCPFWLRVPSLHCLPACLLPQSCRRENLTFFISRCCNLRVAFAFQLLFIFITVWYHWICSFYCKDMLIGPLVDSQCIS